MKPTALFGLLSGVGLVVATLIGVAMLNSPPAQGAATRAALPGCPGGIVAQEGYGLESAGRCTSGNRERAQVTPGRKP